MGEAGRGAAPYDVLLVEDNPGDVRLAREAFAAVDTRVDLTVVTDGRAALDRLRADGGTDLPSLVLLDLHLPGTDGLAVLRECKSARSLRRIPVVVFSSCEDPDAVAELYAHHANAFVRKPQTADGYFDVISRLDAFWFSAAALPEVSGT